MKRIIREGFKMNSIYKSESHQTVLMMWDVLKGRFMGMARGLSEEELDLALHDTTIRGLLTHTAEAELMFAAWYLGKEQPEVLPSSTLEEIIALLELANTHIIDAVQALSEEELHTEVQSKMGASTPVEAVSRLMYHAGMHAGQIAFIKKQEK